MSADSAIPPDTLRAYRETDYRVDTDPPLTLRIDTPCPGLAALHAREGVDCSAFVTACNPFSQPLADTANAQRQEALAADLRQRGLRFVEGRGQHPVDDWGEPSYLVLGIDLPTARTLGAAHGQNALVWSGPDAVPRLVLLR